MPSPGSRVDARPARPTGGRSRRSSTGRARCPGPSGLVVKKGSKARAITSGAMPVPVSVDAERDVLAGPQSRSAPRARRATVGGLDGEPAALGHGVAGVDAEVEERVLELVGVDQRRPEARRAATTSTRRRADGAADQLLHAARRARLSVGRPGLERLAPREGEEPVGERGRAPGRALRGGDVAVDLGGRPWAIRVAISSRLPEMPARRLLKSWASPPVSWPTASIFWLWRSCSSAA